MTERYRKRVNAYDIVATFKHRGEIRRRSRLLPPLIEAGAYDLVAFHHNRLVRKQARNLGISPRKDPFRPPKRKT